MKLGRMSSGPILVDSPEGRGKAMAIILDEKYDFRDIDEVLIIVGPSLDIVIRIEHDDDDITREVFTENYVQHIDGRYGKRDNVMHVHHGPS